MKHVSSLLSIVILLLIGLLLWQWVDVQGNWRNVHWRPPEAIPPNFVTTSPSSRAWYEADATRSAAILERPVFSSTRRPQPIVQALAVARSDPLDTAHLFGIFSGTDGGGAIMRVEGKTRRLKVSDALGDWRFKEIRARDAVFARGGETRSVPLAQARQGAISLAPGLSAVVPAWPQFAAQPAGTPTKATVQAPAQSSATNIPPPPVKPPAGFAIGGSR